MNMSTYIVTVASRIGLGFLNACRVQGADLTILDFGGGTGELVAVAAEPDDRLVIIDQARDRPFDAAIFSHVLALLPDPQALFAEVATYSRPRARTLAIVLDDTGTQADICRESSYNDVLAVVAFFLDAVTDELVERLASAIPRESNGDWVLTTDQRVFIWQL
jgi:hypothetical protein